MRSTSTKTTKADALYPRDGIVGQSLNDGEILREPKWSYWREMLVTCPAGATYEPLNNLLRSFANLYLCATNFTDPEDAAYCHRLIRTEIDACIAAYDVLGVDEPRRGYSSESDGTREDLSATVACLQSRLQQIESIYKRCASRRTVTQYIEGMLLGLVVVPLFLILNWYVFNKLDPDAAALTPEVRGSAQFGTFLGALGAVSSVLLRTTSSTTSIDFESTRHGWHVWANPAAQRGFARVVYGTIFGFVAAWFVHAGLLLPDAVSESLAGANSDVLIIGVVSYAAGFSERLVPDLVIRTARESGGGRQAAGS